MKLNHMTDVTKILILVATIIVVCILCALGFKIVNEGKSAATTNTNNLNRMSSQYQDIDTSLYNGSIIPGSELISLIKKTVEGKRYLCIEVITSDGASKDYNYFYDSENLTLSQSRNQGQTYLETPQEEKSQSGYINSMATFLGETLKDKNESIICIRFKQQP